MYHTPHTLLSLLPSPLSSFSYNWCEQLLHRSHPIIHPSHRCLFLQYLLLSSAIFFTLLISHLSPSLPPASLLSLHQAHFCSVYSPKLQLPNKVKPNPSSLGSTLSHPIWKSCFFPCGSGVLFTGDSCAGNGTGHRPDGQARGFNAYQAKSQPNVTRVKIV